MPQETVALDALIMSSRCAPRLSRPTLRGVRDAIDQAIREATQALVDTLKTPFDEPGLTRARNAIEVAEDVIAALCEEMLRSERVRRREAALQGRAREIVERARAPRA